LPGEAVPIADPVGTANNVLAFFSVSRTGALIYRSGNQSQSQLSWMDRTGKVLSNAMGPGSYSEIALSPDAKTVAMTSGAIGQTDISVLDLMRSVNTRLTFDRACGGCRGMVAGRETDCL
jgi:hypothetical protein